MCGETPSSVVSWSDQDTTPRGSVRYTTKNALQLNTSIDSVAAWSSPETSTPRRRVQPPAIAADTATTVRLASGEMCIKKIAFTSPSGCVESSKLDVGVV